MLIRKYLEPHWADWNRKWAAPYGRGNLRELNGKLDAVAPGLITESGLFSVQSNSDTRIFEYPWAYFAAALKAPMKILEVGGGLAGFQFVLNREGHAVDNVDPGVEVSGGAVSPQAMQLLNRAFGTQVRLYDCGIEEAQLAERIYDRAFCLSVIEHMPPAVAAAAMDKVHAALKPGGLFVLTVDLFLDVVPFSRKLRNRWGQNAAVRELIDSDKFELLHGDPRELFGFAEFDPQEILANLDRYYIGRAYPVLSQALVLRRRDHHAVRAQAHPAPAASGQPLSFLVFTDLCLDPQRSSSQTHVSQVLEFLLLQGHRVAYGYFFGPTGQSSRFLQGLLQSHAQFSIVGLYGARLGRLPDFDVLYLTNLWSPETLQAAGSALHALREARQPPFVAVFDSMDCVFKGRNTLLKKNELEALHQLELRLHRAVDHSVMISEQERSDAVRGFGLPEQRISVVAQSFPLYQEGLQRPYLQRSNLCFVGAVHPGNIEGLAHFLNHIFARVLNKLPEIEFHIIGAGTEALKLNFPQSILDHVKVLGFVENIHASVAAYRIQVLPLLSGSGIKGKLLQSFACGTPVVSSRKGAEGMNLADGRECLIQDAADAFADAAVRLYQDEALWTHLRDGGRRFVAEHYSQQALDAQLHALLRKIKPI